jgi:selenide,water dikinase
MSAPPTTPIRLTAYSHGAGCACKLGILDLAEVLRHLPGIEDPRVLVDAATRDDAAVFALSADRALIATVDFFMPVVDDARTWGAISATNALSDIYAMGGTPLFGLNLVGWPREKLPFELLGEVIQGGAEAARRAHCLVLGGHSVDSPEPQFGMVVIGDAHPDRLITVANGRSGDVLVLTKPLGTGILTTALKRGRIGEPELAEAVRSMTTLNDGGMRAARAAGVRAGTDVTGFGLIGHLGNLTRASGLAAEIAVSNLPLMAGVRELAAAGLVPGGTTRNLDAATQVEWAAGVSEIDRVLVADAQTSGGLLLAVAPERLDTLLASLASEQTLASAVIGRLVAGSAGTIRVEA